MKLLYLHGFNSSSKSGKATAFGQWLAHNKLGQLIVPELSPFPDQAYKQAQDLVPQCDLIIGSSLGGYYATALSQQFGKRAVVINSSVRPFELLRDYLGENVNPYTQNRYTLTAHHLAFLKGLYAPLKDPKLLFLLQQKGDEILDWKEAANFYKDARCVIEAGGDHAFQGMERFYETILEFGQA